MLLIVMISAVILGVTFLLPCCDVMLNLVMLIVMLGVLMMNVVLFNFIMLNVTAPFRHCRIAHA